MRGVKPQSIDSQSINCDSPINPSPESKSSMKFEHDPEDLAYVPAKGDESPLAAQNGVALWQYVWARAIARAWQDPNQERDWTKAFLSGDPQLVRGAFNQLGYELPKGLKLTVAPAAAGVEYNPEAPWSDPPVNGWDQCEAGLGATLTMVLPPAPRDTKLHAMALTDYEASGQNYPFTF